METMMEDNVVVVNGKPLSDAEVIVMKVALDIYKNILEATPHLYTAGQPSVIGNNEISVPIVAVERTSIHQAQLDICNSIITRFTKE